MEGVLAATLEEFAEHGWDGLHIDQVAQRANVNKTTIYRRWPTKSELVAAAVESMRRVVHDVPLPDTGALDRDLIEAFHRRVTFADRTEGQAWAHLLTERHDPEVEAIIGGAVKERSDAWYTMVTRAALRGELPKGTDPRLLLGMVGAIVDAWNAKAKGRLKPELLEAAVRTVVVGARSGTLVPATEPPARRATRK